MLHAMHGNMFTNPLIVVDSLQPSTAKMTLYSFRGLSDLVTK